MESKEFKLTKIQPTGHVQWDIYTILHKAWAPYRKITITSGILDKEKFNKTMLYSEYVKIEATSPLGEPIIVTILNDKNGSSIADTTEQFKLFFNSIRSKNTKIIMISKNPFQTHVVNYIMENKFSDEIQRIDYTHIKHVLPLGPGCSVHTILTPAQKEELLNELKTAKKSLKPIYTSDPMCFWTGAQPDQLVMIQRLNPASGIGTDVRRVVKVLSF